MLWATAVASFMSLTHTSEDAGPAMSFAKNTQAKGRQPKGKKCLGAPLLFTAEVNGLQDMSHAHLHTGLLETYSVSAV